MGQISSRNEDIKELSKLLNQLPIHEERPDAIKFRNPNGVSLKLGNFMAIDPEYSGKGMSRSSKLDKEVFNEFINDRSELHTIATQIRQTISDSDLGLKLYQIEKDELPETMVREGEVIYRLHKHIERSNKIVQIKKQRHLDRFDKLDCEVCTFDFFNKYGDLGYGYIECHHRQPLSTISGASKTTLADLALVCANCHRMLHRGLNTLTVRGLRAQISNSSF